MHMVVMSLVDINNDVTLVKGRQAENIRSRSGSFEAAMTVPARTLERSRRLRRLEAGGLRGVGRSAARPGEPPRFLGPLAGSFPCSGAGPAASSRRLRGAARRVRRAGAAVASPWMTMEARRRRSDEWRAWGTARIMGRCPPSLAGISNRRVVVGRDETPRSDGMALSPLVHARLFAGKLPANASA